MATGFEQRPTTRQTFAFQTTAPVQGRSAASGQSRGAQVVGGQSQGGVVAAGPQTDAGPVAAGLGAYVAQIMEPHIQQRQTEEFFKGFTKAQEGIALDELVKDGGLTTKVFGPTAYEQGAAAFIVKAKLTDWNTAMIADRDRLKTLSPEQAAKEIAAKSMELMTGHREIDMLIQQGLIEMTGPLLNTVAKARDGYLQEQQSLGWGKQAGSAAANLQAVATAQAALSGPEASDGAAVEASLKNFLGSMAQPEGMHDETYKTGLFNFMRSAMQGGNFRAVEALREAGIDRVFDDGEQVRLEDAYKRYSERALEDFTANDQKFSQMAMSYENDLALILLNQKEVPPPTPVQMAGNLAAMNDYVSRMTGVKEPLFDFKDIKGEVRSAVSHAASAWLRAESRHYQQEERNEATRQRIAEREQDNREAARAAGAAWATGDVNRALVMGVEERHFERIALAQFRNGDYNGLKRAFTVGNFVANSVKSDIQSAVRGSLDEQYGKLFGKVHETWRAMLKVNPGMTASYFGEYHEKMRAFDTLSRQLGPIAAYRSAFGDAALYSKAQVPAEFRKEADGAIKATVASGSPSSWNPFATKYSPQAVRVMQNLLQDDLALAIQNSDTPSGALAPELLSSAIASGRLQTAGGEAWRAPPGTKPFHAQIGLPRVAADKVFRAQVDFRLKRAGFAAGINSTLEIAYIDTPNGKPALRVVGRDGAGASQGVLIPMQAFKDEANGQYQRAHPKLTGKGNPLGQGYPLGNDAQAMARGQILPTERLEVRDGQAWAVNRNKPTQRRKVRSDWASRPVMHPEYLISN